MSLYHIEKRGNGPALVLIHGFLESSEIWLDLSLEDHFTCYYVDLPGHGKCQFEEFTFISEIADQIKSFLHKEKILDYQLMGHSLGGYVSLALASIDSSCSHVCLVNSNFWSDDDAKKGDRLRVAELVMNHKELFIREAIPNLFGSPMNFKKEIENLIEKAYKIPSEAIAASSKAMSIREDYSSWVNSNQAKIQIIQGTQDRTVSIELMKKHISNFPYIEYNELNTGHMSWCENPQSLRELILITGTV